MQLVLEIKRPGRETLKQHQSNSKMKDKRDKTTYPLILQITFRTAVRSRAGYKRDVRYGNTLKTVINFLDLQETLS
jgi:hypothetical protein